MLCKYFTIVISNFLLWVWIRSEYFVFSVIKEKVNGEVNNQVEMMMHFKSFT